MTWREERTIRKSLQWLIRAQFRNAIRQEQTMADLTNLNLAVQNLEGLVSTLAQKVTDASNADQPAVDAVAQGINDFVAQNTPPV